LAYTTNKNVLLAFNITMKSTLLFYTSFKLRAMHNA